MFKKKNHVLSDVYLITTAIDSIPSVISFVKTCQRDHYFLLWCYENIAYKLSACWLLFPLCCIVLVNWFMNQPMFKPTSVCTSVYARIRMITYFLFISSLFLIHVIIPFGKFGSSYPGKATAAARAALPSPTSACWRFSCFRNPPNSDVDCMIFNVCMYIVIIIHSLFYKKTNSEYCRGTEAH